MSERERVAVPHIPNTDTSNQMTAPRRCPSAPEFPPEILEQSIHRLFETRVRQFPDNVAVKTPSSSLTYAELNGAANRIAQLIMERLGDGTAQVGLLLSNGPLMLSAILGVLKAGKVYVPLDPHFPEKRLAFMIDDAEISILLTESTYLEFAKTLAETRPILNLENTERFIDAKIEGQRSDPQIAVSSRSMAYILYTSGSTGKPKGIAFGHRNLIHTTMCLINKLEITSADRITQLHSTSFSASVVDIYCALFTGATLYPWDVKQDGFAGLADWLMRERITSLQWIPTPFRHFVDTFDGSESFPSLRQIVMASEPLTVKEATAVRRHFPSTCRLVNQMGTSESYNYRLYFLENDTPIESAIIPAGYPVSTQREVLILDDDGREVPVGQEGEIAIRSPYMSLGYWKNDTLNQQKFVTDQHDPETQIFLTGDLGYLRADGCLIHLGRKDFQIKLHGYRIELGEIEARLCELEDITEAVVQSTSIENDDLQLVAYIITKSGEMPKRPLLQSHLAAMLPDYMIPNAYVRLNQLPVTDTGKLDRRALPQFDFGLNGRRSDRAKLSKQPALPNGSTSTQEVLLQIWRNVLETDELTPHDNFFDMGGHSLKMAQMLQYVHKELGQKLPYALLTQNPTVAEIAKWLDKEQDQTVPSIAALADTDTAAPDGLLRGILNRVWQALALYAPGRKSLRVHLHRLRGVTIGQNVAIGIAALIETSYPRLISIGDNSAIGIRTVIIGHFVDGLGATPSQKGTNLHTSANGANKSVIIEEDVFIGPMVTILPNVTIGRGSVVAAGSVVNRSIPPRTMVQGNPAKVIARCPVPLTENHSYEEFLSHVEFLED